MDQFSHDLTVALEETSLLDRARVSRWGQQRRRTRSTGNLPCAPQPTEDSSSPTDAVLANSIQTAAHTNDGLDGQNTHLPSDSDEKADTTILRLPSKAQNTTIRLLGTLESDSLNETFSPARFFKPNARRKRKLKRISMDYEISTGLQDQIPETSATSTANVSISSAISFTPSVAGSMGSLRKRVLKPDPNNRSQLFFCGKRKRSNRDRYHELDHASSVPRHATQLEEYRMRPRSFSSTSKPHSERLQPLNKGLLSKIERISQLQKNENNPEINNDPVEPGDLNAPECLTFPLVNGNIEPPLDDDDSALLEVVPNVSQVCADALLVEENFEPESDSLSRSKVKLFTHIPQQEINFSIHRKKRSSHSHRRRPLQFAVDQHSMDCEEFNEFSSSSSLSSTDSEDNHAINDTDREGDDELTDWPGNENICGELKYDCKRKLTKRSTLPQIKSDPESVGSFLMAEDDTVMSNNTTVGDATPLNWPSSLVENRELASELPYQSSEPIAITNKSGFSSLCRGNVEGVIDDDITIPLKHIESEMSGETSNPFLSSPPCQPSEVREIRAGCRRVNGERPGFSIKTSVNERLARFLQDSRQLQIRLPDLEIYEHESLLNLATLYSLQMSLDNGCAVLNKTSNTTQSVHIDQQDIQSGLLLGDFKRRCYDSNGKELLHK